MEWAKGMLVLGVMGTIVMVLVVETFNAILGCGQPGGSCLEWLAPFGGLM